VGQLLIVAPHPKRPVDSVAREAEDIARAFSDTWAFSQRQVLSCDATIRDLYETSSEHAFIELWEKRLHQSPESIKAFGRPILGGGLRLVMPPVPQNQSEPMIEVKIESYLKDTSKLFLEAQFTWRQPEPPGVPLNPTARLERVDNYIQKEVVGFMEGP
jgi:hypothetical protein